MLTGKPTGNSSKRFAFRIRMSEKQSLLAIHEKENLNNNIDYIDILSALLYTDSEQNIDIREFLRVLLFALAQRYTNEEIKEILVSSISEHFDTQHFLTAKNSKESRRYMDLILSLAKENNVQGHIIGNKGLFEDVEQFDKRFTKNIKKPLPDDRGETENDYGASTNTANSSEKEEGTQELVSTIRNNIEAYNVSPLSKAFISAIVQAGEIGLMSKEEIDEYICTMLHGIGLVIPKITEEEIEAMTKELKTYIDKRIRYILERNIQHFERDDEEEGE